MNEKTTMPRRRPIIRTMGIVSSAIAGISILSIAAFGGTYALWNDGVALNAGTIGSGSLTLLVNGESSITLPTSSWQNMLPGDRNTRQVTVSTPGTVDSTVTVASTATAGAHQVRVRNGACPGTALGGAALGSTPVSLGAWAAGQASIVCVEVVLPATASASTQGTSTPITLDFRATQVAN